jgi:VanZ family protein
LQPLPSLLADGSTKWAPTPLVHNLWQESDSVRKLVQKVPDLQRNKAVHRLLAAAAWIAFGVIVFATLSPLNLRPTATRDPNLERFVAYALLGLLFGLAYPRRLVACLLLVVAAAGVLETLQLVMQDRHGHLLDALVKAAGGVFGIGIAFVVVLMAERSVVVSPVQSRPPPPS